MHLYIRLILSLFALSVLILSRDLPSNDDEEVLRRTFAAVEEALSSGDETKLFPFFTDKPYLSLSNGITGYFSSSHAYNIMRDFFRVYKPITFKFDRISTEVAYPFGSGELLFNIRGKRSAAQVFVSLKKVEDRWEISQITID
jgi:hypothetical protein